jgi:hypothetical protein
MQRHVNEVIIKCHSNLNLFAENVIRMLLSLTTSSDVDVASAAAETVSIITALLNQKYLDSNAHIKVFHCVSLTIFLHISTAICSAWTVL